jgi:hypothetical protein
MLVAVEGAIRTPFEGTNRVAAETEPKAMYIKYVTGELISVPAVQLAVILPFELATAEEIPEKEGGTRSVRLALEVRC